MNRFVPGARRPSKTTMPGSKSKSAYQVNVQIEEAFAGDVPARLLRAAAQAALSHQRAAPGALSISLTGDETLQALNRDYLDVDQPTDVLSFPSETDDPDRSGRYFGDIAISYPRALAQAQAGGHAVEDELQLLTVHGVLHLLGHDHQAGADKQRMWQAQAEILAGLGSAIAGPGT
jgi:probable rRNA maturation factor